MSRTIDEKVVEMKFDNKDFEKNVKTSLTTLEKLKESLNLDQAVSKMESAKNAISKIKLFGGVKDEVEDVKIQFDGVRIFWEQVIRNMANAAYNFGSKIFKGLLGPLTEGGMSRALNIEQAKFQLKGLGVAWKDIYDDIDYAVAGTAYGLDSAAKAASQLTASGVQMGDAMKTALRGISGVAAMTNREYDDVAHIFTTIAGNGRLMGMQLTQLSSYGLNVAATLAESMGTTEAAVREMVSQGKIDFATFAAAMDNAFGEHAKDANETFTGALNNMKFAVKKIGAEVSAIYIDNMKDVFNAIRPFINAIKDGLMPIIASDIDKDTGLYSLLYILGQVTKTKAVAFFNNLTEAVQLFNEKGGFRNIADSLANVMVALSNLIKPIKKAFVDVFGDANKAAHPFVNTLVLFTEKLREFTKSLITTDGVGEAIYSTFKGVFSIFKMIITVIGKILSIVVPVLSTLFNIVVRLSGAIVNLVSSFIDWAKTAKPISNALKTIGSVLLTVVGIAIYAISSFVKWVSSLEIVKAGIYLVKSAIDGIATAIKNLVDWIGDVVSAAKRLNIEEFAGYLQNKIQTSVRNIYNEIRNNHPVIYGMLIAIKAVITTIGTAIMGLLSIVKKVGIAIIDVIKDLFISIQNGDLEGFLSRLKDRFVVFGETISNIFGGKDDPSSLATKLNKLGEAIRNFFANLDPGTVVAFAFSAALINLIVNISKFTKILGGFVTTLQGFVKQFTAPLKKISSIFESKIVHKIVQMIGFIAAITIALKAISEIPQDALIRAGIALGVFVGTMMLFVSLMTILDKKMKTVKGAGISNMSTTIYAMSTSILAIAAALKILESVDMDVEEISLKLGGITLAVAALGAIAVMMSKFAGDKKVLSATISILALCAGVLAITIALNKITQLPLENLKENLAVVISIMAVLGILALALSNIKFTGVVGILLLCANIDLVMSALEKTFGSRTIRTGIARIEDGIKRFCNFAFNEWKLVAAGIVAMLVTTVAITAQIYYLSKSAQNIGKAFFNVGLGLIAIAAAMTIIEKMKISDETKNIAAIFMVLSGIFSAIIVGMSRIDDGNKDEIAEKAKGMEKTIKAISKFMIAVGASLLLMTPAMYVLSKMSWEEWVKPMIALAVLLSGMATIVGLSRKTEGLKSGPIIAVMATLVIIFSEMVVLSLIPWEKLLPAVAAVGVAIFGLGNLFKHLGELSKNNVGLKKFLSIAGQIILAVAAVVVIGQVMKDLASSTNDWTLLAASGASIAIGMLVLGRLLEVISKSSGLGNASTARRKAGVIAATAIPIVALGFAVKLIASSSDDYYTLAISGGVIIIGLATLGLVLENISSMQTNGNIWEKIGIMILIAVDMAVLGATIGKLASTITNFANFLAASTVIIGSMFALAAVVSIVMNAGSSSGNIAGAIAALVGMIIVAGQVIAVGYALSEVAKFDWQNILVSMIAVIAVLGVMNGLVIAMGVVFAGLAETGLGIIGLLAVVAVLAEIAWQLEAFARAANSFANAVTAVVQGIGIAAQGLGMLVEPLKQLAELELASIGGGLIVLAAGIAAVGVAGIVLGIGALGIILAAAGVAGLGLALQLYQGIDIESIAKGLIKLKDGMSGLVIAGVEGIVAAIGIGAMAAALGILSVAVSKSADVFKMAMTLMKSEYMITLAMLQVKSVEIGLWIAKSLALGMVAGVPIVAAAAKLLGSTIENEVRDKVDVHSQSDLFTTIGEWIPKSVAIGIGDEAGAVIDAITSMCNGMEIPFIGSIENMINAVHQFGNELDAVFGAGSKGTKFRSGMGGAPAEAQKAYDAAHKNRTGLALFNDYVTDAYNTVENLTGSLFDASSAMENFGEATSGAGGAAGTAKDAFQELTDTIKNQMDIFSEFSKGEEISGDQMLNNMRSQVDGVANWANNMQVLAERGISQGLLEQLGQLGPQGSAKVEAFVQMTDAQLQEANQLFAVSLQLPGWAATSIVGSYGYAGMMSAQGFAQGLDPNAGIANATAMGLNSVNALNKSLEVHSPSRKTIRTGENVSRGLGMGMKNLENYVVNVGIIISMNLYNAIKNELQHSKFMEIGENICAGLIAGIGAGASGVITAAVNMAKSAYETAKEALDINSPSKKFAELGMGVDEGFALGINENKNLSNAAAEEMGMDALDIMRNTMSQINDLMNGRYEFDPVIRPTLDFTDLDRGFQEIDSMMRAKKIGVEMTGKSTEDQKGQPTNYNFVQNNYSPKALNRTEIYRQTRSQFSQFRNSVENSK